MESSNLGYLAVWGCCQLQKMMMMMSTWLLLFWMMMKKKKKTLKQTWHGVAVLLPRVQTALAELA
jgi:hypothetical protein